MFDRGAIGHRRRPLCRSEFLLGRSIAERSTTLVAYRFAGRSSCSVVRSRSDRPPSPTALPAGVLARSFDRGAIDHRRRPLRRSEFLLGRSIAERSATVAYRFAGRGSCSVVRSRSDRPPSPTALPVGVLARSFDRGAIGHRRRPLCRPEFLLGRSIAERSATVAYRFAGRSSCSVVRSRSDRPPSPTALPVGVLARSFDRGAIDHRRLPLCRSGFLLGRSIAERSTTLVGVLGTPMHYVPARISSINSSVSIRPA